MNKEHEIELYKELAKEIKSYGFRCFLYNEDTSAWLYIITQIGRASCRERV